MGNIVKYLPDNSNLSMLLTLNGRVGNKSAGLVGTIKTAKDNNPFA